MIAFRQGDLFASGAEAIVNPVNCVGVMGKGLALQFKERFPGNYKSYREACGQGLVVPGEMFVVETGQALPRLIINFPTKRHWRDRSRMDDIEAGLSALVHVIDERDIRSIAVPALGSGLGGLDWADVRNRIASALGSLHDVDVTVYEPA